MMVAIPSRNIASGEYVSSYGSGQSHSDIFFKYMNFRRQQEAEITTQVVVDNIIITVHYKGKLGKYNMEEINLFCQKGFIKDISY
jgi:hypothetical protein